MYTNPTCKVYWFWCGTEFDLCDLLIIMDVHHIYFLLFIVWLWFVLTDSHLVCFLCESPVDVKFEPCGHALMCHNCANRAKKCPTCKVMCLFVSLRGEYTKAIILGYGCNKNVLYMHSITNSHVEIDVSSYLLNQYLWLLRFNFNKSRASIWGQCLLAMHA